MFPVKPIFLMLALIFQGPLVPSKPELKVFSHKRTKSDYRAYYYNTDDKERNKFIFLEGVDGMRASVNGKITFFGVTKQPSAFNVSEFKADNNLSLSIKTLKKTQIRPSYTEVVAEITLTQGKIIAFKKQVIGDERAADDIAN